MKIKKKIVCLSSGGNHTSFVTEYGYVFVFGSTLHEKLGIDNCGLKDISKPTLLPLSEEIQFCQVACGDYHTLGLSSDGEVWSWGGTLHKKLGTRDPKPNKIRVFNQITVIKIGCGDFHSVALTNYGILYSWGGGGKSYNFG